MPDEIAPSASVRLSVRMKQLENGFLWGFIQGDFLNVDEDRAGDLK
jgi:hypothetical protein